VQQGTHGFSLSLSCVVGQAHGLKEHGIGGDLVSRAGLDGLKDVVKQVGLRAQETQTGPSRLHTERGGAGQYLELSPPPLVCGGPSDAEWHSQPRRLTILWRNT
jgi:hypothetical protein